jgi:hypothetical protein
MVTKTIITLLPSSRVAKYFLPSHSREETAVSGQFRKRSVAAHTTVCDSTGNITHLALFGGEVSPSDRGHEGAGGFESDVLLFELDAEGALKLVDCTFSPACEVPRGR